jgi:hypothetical protein
MNRKEFLINIGWVLGGSVALQYVVPQRLLRSFDKPVKGTVRSGKNGVEKVIVSDGYSVVATDKNGRYELFPHPAAQSVFVSTPAGFAFQNTNGISRHYKLMRDINRKKDLDFNLNQLEKNDDEHQFIIWADPQVKNDKDVNKMMQQSVPDVQQLVHAAGAGALLHGITVGDIVWDAHQFYPDYDKAVAKMGMPFFQCLGNHDMDYNNVGDEDSDITFRENYGPTYYSFNRGQLHYVVMDNVRYLGKDRNYDGFFQQNQLDWLQKDLAFVPKDKLIILCTHIPVHSGTKNNDALYDLLEGRQVHIMSGHTHYHVNAIKNENIYEHNHGTVCGAWWTGPICGDGTPCGYGVYSAKGNQLSWHYQSTGKDADHQFSIHTKDFSVTEQLVEVNIWNFDPAWSTALWVDDVFKGSLEQYEGFDSVAYASLIGPGLPKARGFAEPRLTDHLFKATIPITAKKIKIEVMDRFGKKYTNTKNI